MFFLLGLGLGKNQVTLEALECLKKCGCVYVEAYTNIASAEFVSFLEKQIRKKIIRLNRFQVEEEFGKILENAKSEDIALCVVGNPLIATTHLQLLLDAKEAGVKFRVVQGISVQNYLAETGLDAYKFGRIATIVAPDKKTCYAPESFFDFIEKNNSLGLHSLCLLDIKSEAREFMSVRNAIELLEKIALKRKTRIISQGTFVGLAGLGSKKRLIRAGNAEEIKKFPLAPLPQCLVVCGRPNEKEKEALKALSALKVD